MIFYWTGLLDLGDYGSFSIEANSLEEARTIIKRKLTKRGSMDVLKEGVLGNVSEICVNDLNVIFTTEPKVLTKGKCLVAMGKTINPMELIAQGIKDKLNKNRQEIETISINAFFKEITTKEASVKLKLLEEVQDDLYIMLGKVLEKIRGDKNKTSKKLCNAPVPLIDEENIRDVDSGYCLNLPEKMCIPSRTIPKKPQKTKKKKHHTQFIKVRCSKWKQCNLSVSCRHYRDHQLKSTCKKDGHCNNGNILISPKCRKSKGDRE